MPDLRPGAGGVRRGHGHCHSRVLPLGLREPRGRVSTGPDGLSGGRHAEQRMARFINQQMLALSSICSFAGRMRG